MSDPYLDDFEQDLRGLRESQKRLRASLVSQFDDADRARQAARHAKRPMLQEIEAHIVNLLAIVEKVYAGDRSVRVVGPGPDPDRKVFHLHNGHNDLLTLTVAYRTTCFEVRQVRKRGEDPKLILKIDDLQKVTPMLAEGLIFSFLECPRALRTEV